MKYTKVIALGHLYLWFSNIYPNGFPVSGKYTRLLRNAICEDRRMLFKTITLPRHSDGGSDGCKGSRTLAGKVRVYGNGLIYGGKHFNNIVLLMFQI